MTFTKKLIHPSYAGNIPRLYLHSAFTNFLLLFPIWVIFLQEERRLTLAQVTLTDVAFWLTMALAEIPTGMVADVLGRKQSMLLHVLLAGFSIFMFALAPTFPLLMVANSLWAIALTFESGAGLSLLYESLLQEGRLQEYTRFRGRLAGINIAAIGVAGALGGLIAERDLFLPFWITGGLTLFALVFVLTMKEPPYEADEATGERVTFINALRTTLEALRGEPNLRYLLAYASLLPMGVGMIQVLFIQPFSLSIGIPIAAIGFLMFGLRVFSITGAASAERMEKALGESGALWTASLLVVVGLLGIGVFNSVTGILVFGVALFANAAVGPLTENIILRYTPGAVRATVLSVAALFSRLLVSLVEPWMGVIGDRQGLPGMFLILALITLVALGLVMAFWRRTWDLTAAPEKGPRVEQA